MIKQGNSRFLTPEPQLASTPLRLALLCAHWRAALALLEAGDDGSPLHPADKQPCFQLAVSGLLDQPDMEIEGVGLVFARLFALGHSPNDPGRDPETPFWRLIGGPSAIRMPAVTALLTLGVGPNDPRADGEEPIMMAARQNLDALASELLRFGAGDGPRGASTPLIRALKESAFDAALALLETPSEAALAHRDRLGRGPLWHACHPHPSHFRGAGRYVRATREAVARRLMELGQSPLEADQLGSTPLAQAQALAPEREDFARIAEVMELHLAAGPALALSRPAKAL